MSKLEPPTLALRSGETRERLIAAGLDLFGRHGFEGTSTRALAQQAGVNLGAIPYHFGGKEKLYLAVAAHVSAQIRANLGAPSKEIAADPRTQLHAMVERIIDVLTMRPETEQWARFILREQMAPTPAFDILFREFIEPIQGRICALWAKVTSTDPRAPETLAQGLALFGQILVFRLARATALRRFATETLGEAEVAAIKRVVHRNLDAALDKGGIA